MDSKLPLHLVLKAKKGVLRLFKTQRIVDDEVYRWAAKCGVTIYEYANAGNHLHAAVRVKNLSQWSRFIRGLTGSIAKKLKAAGITIEKGLWLKRPYTRIVKSWQQAFRSLKRYVMHNRWEAEGNVNPKRRQDLKMLYALWREDALMSTS